MNNNKESETELAQLLCSRLCHDLVGPAGAINAGLELSEDDGFDESTIELMAMSAQEISRRLAFFRLAFGAASSGGEGGSGFKGQMLRETAVDFLSESKAVLEWRDDPQNPDVLPPTSGKALLLLIMIASECLPRGGTINVQLANLPEGLGLAVLGAGQGAALRADTLARLSNDPIEPTDLTARNVHAELTRRLIENANGHLEVNASDDDEVRLTALFPA